METLLMLSILILTIISAWFLGMAINYKRCADKNIATVKMYRRNYFRLLNRDVQVTPQPDSTGTYIIEDHNVRSDS